MTTDIAALTEEYDRAIRARNAERLRVLALPNSERLLDNAWAKHTRLYNRVVKLGLRLSAAQRAASGPPRCKHGTHPDIPCWACESEDS